MFKFQPDVCNVCHDVLMVPMNLNDIAIVNIKGADSRCIINELAKVKNPNMIKVNTDIKKEFDRKHVHNKTLLKTKIKSYSYEVTDFYAEEISYKDCNHTCLAVISLSAALKKDE